MFESVLIATRGVVAARVAHTCHRIGVKSLAVHSEADVGGLHTRIADESMLIGPAPYDESYLDADRVIEAAHVTEAQAIHPGSSVLGDRADVARRVIEAGLAWVGAPADALDVLSDRAALRRVLDGLDIPVAPADPPDHPGVRYVDVVLVALAGRRTAVLGHRDCSLRRDSRLAIAETPAPGVSDDRAAELAQRASAILEAVSYEGLACVRFQLDEQLAFRAVAPTLPPAHEVTELVTGLDLVEQQLLLAAGDPLSFDPDEPAPTSGHSIGVRVFAAAPGKLGASRYPSGDDLRVDAGYEKGDTVPPTYDRHVATIAAVAPDRPAAIARLREALAELSLDDIETDAAALTDLLDDPRFADGEYDVRMSQ